MSCILKVAMLLLCFVSLAFSAPQFLTISDIHYGAENTEKDGQDTGNEFLAVTLKRLEELTQKVDFILYLGDLPTHSLFSTIKKEEYEKVVFHGLYEADQGKKPMFYVTGNNDSLLGNYQPFSSNGKSPLSFASDWTGACAYCDELIIDATPMYQHGYYSSYVIPNNKDIILIALNSVQWTKTPILLPKYPNQKKDAFMQLSWLEQQLKNHHAKQLLLAMHVPPGTAYNGTSFWHEIYLDSFLKLLDKYHHSYDQITLLFSHSHMEEFRKIKLSDGTNIYAYSTPGISRVHHNNPGMKIFTLDKKMRIRNFITYFTSDLYEWGNECYQAMSAPDAIFPKCQNQTMSQCLGALSSEQVCDNLEHGLFYGVKSTHVPDQACRKTYQVN
ncbi:metallophosphatase [Legionella norrlandica]|uniref:Metallophosphatase n=1 Tax=Legionella norrlandica TaxID=1498499 RepID=A0A0A2SWX0_9GAMM|nr:metallophosphoesterase [Legionella norrlandica]KGP64236.1 metallophosphatase [Legionella norrlandica]